MTIGNIISKLASANRLYAEARVEKNDILKDLWREERVKLEAQLADLGIIVEHPAVKQEGA